jgi:hypothetical protein
LRGLPLGRGLFWGLSAAQHGVLVHLKLHTDYNNNQLNNLWKKIM